MLAVPDGALLVLDDVQWASRLELAVIEAIAGEAGLGVLILALARSAADLSGLTAARALRAAQDAQLLVPGTCHPGWLAFRHALVRESLLQTISASAGADLHRRIGIVLEPWTGTDPEALVGVAYHLGAASGVAGWRRAVRYGLPVARAAYDAGVYHGGRVQPPARGAALVVALPGDACGRVRRRLRVCWASGSHLAGGGCLGAVASCGGCAIVCGGDYQ